MPIQKTNRIFWDKKRNPWGKFHRYNNFLKKFRFFVFSLDWRIKIYAKDVSLIDFKKNIVEANYNSNWVNVQAERTY